MNLRALYSDGWMVLEGAVPAALLREMRFDLDYAYAVCRAVQTKNGVAEETEGTVHHLPAITGPVSFLEFLESNPAAPYIGNFFGGRPYILQSMGGNFNLPGATNYAATVHRDIRSYFHDRLMINTLVALDDLTAENGATWLLPGSQDFPEKPDDEMFDAGAVQAIASAGSIVMWDSRLWHRAGVNRTKAPRRIVTPIFTLPFYKQGFDYCRALDERMYGFSEELRQVLGWYARTPSSLDEWYAPPNQRMYLGGQG